MLRVLQPCPRKWTELAGDHRRRYCDDCGKFVHAVECLSDAERAELLSRPSGFCVSLHAPPPKTARRAVLLAGFFGALRPLWAQTGELRVIVKDLTGQSLRPAQATATTPLTGLLARAETNAEGVAVLRNLPLHTPISLEVYATGFSTGRASTTLTGAAATLEIVLQVGSVGGPVVVGVEPMPVEATEIQRQRKLDLPDPPPLPIFTAPRKRSWWRRLTRG